MSRRPERGQVSAERVGVGVLVAGVLGVLFSTGLRSNAEIAVEEAVCTIFNLGDDCGGSADGGGPNNPDGGTPDNPNGGTPDNPDGSNPDEPEAGEDPDGGNPDDPDAGDPDEPDEPEEQSTPLERALAGDYVAIGDSFSSGEGAGDYEDGTDCRRSANAYPERIAGQYDFEGEVHNVTCTGAVVDNAQNSGQHGEPPQVEAITDDTSLVTIGIGGNDTGWTDVVQACLMPQFFDGCEDTDAVRQAMEEAAVDIGGLYQDVAERAPDDARIVAVGYPRFFPEDPDETYRYCLGPTIFGRCTSTSLTIDEETQRWMNDMFREFNDTLEREADAAGIEFVDMYDAFDGCELTTSDACMHGLKADLTSWPPVHSDSFHPNAEGHDRMTDLVAEQMEEPE